MKDNEKAFSSVTSNDLEAIVSDGLCVSCGFCAVSLNDKESPVSMEFDEVRGYFTPRVSEVRETGPCICPGAEMDMQWLSKRVHGGEPDDPILGHHNSIRAAYASDAKTRERAASGGVIPALLHYLFRSKNIDMAYCAMPSDDVHGAAGQLIHTTDQIKDISGSIYHPVNFGASLSDLIGSEGRFAFVGLPCQVAALEVLKRHIPELSDRHVLSIGLFCGGINTYDGVGYYLKGFEINPDSVTKIEYRHGRWPGKIKVELSPSGEVREVPRIRGNTRWKILRYVIAFQGYWMLPRCRMCPDQVADFADISVGDPHLEKFRQRKDPGVSAVVTRTPRGLQILEQAVEAGWLDDEPLSREEVVASQSYTLDNRRHVVAYQKVGRYLGLKSPSVTAYAQLEQSLSARHFVYAWVDLMKLVWPKRPPYTWLYIPWQIFEYVFITFTPSLILKRLGKLMRNR